MRDHAPHTRRHAIILTASTEARKLTTAETDAVIGMGEAPRREPVPWDWLDTPPKSLWWVAPAHLAVIVAGLLIAWVLA